MADEIEGIAAGKPWETVENARGLRSKSRFLHLDGLRGNVSASVLEGFSRDSRQPGSYRVCFCGGFGVQALGGPLDARTT